MWQNIENKEGVTLVELIIVIAIIGILALLSTIGVEVIRSERVSSASRGLLGDLQKARIDAMTQLVGANTRGFGIRFASATSYTIFRFEDADMDYIYDAGEDAATTTITIPTSVGLAIEGSPAFNVLIFNRQGIPRRYDGAGNQQALGNMTISVAHTTDTSVQQKCISVSTNRIREGLWNGAVCTEQ